MKQLCLLVAAIGVSSVLSQASGYPHGGGSCVDDWDCSLGGECNNNVCACDIWFTGFSCQYLNLQPAEPDYGMQIPTYYSWGGHCIQNATTGVYHGYFSFMCNHSTLGSWTTASSVVHATAAQSQGPYEFQEMIIQPWAHNAYIVQDPPSGKFLLWHIGNGVVNPDKWAPCYTNSTDASAESNGNDILQVPTSKAGQGQAFIQVSDSLEGPWTPFNNNTGITVDFAPGYWTNSIAGNPSPFIFDNGTVLLYFTGETCPNGWGNLAPACIGLARADSWEGPYTTVGSLPIIHPESEDPSVFQDPRVNFHLLTNVNTYHARCAQGVPCGGHAWSRDAINWSNVTIGAFGPVIRFSNGSYWYNAYTERPQVLQAADRTPLTFFVGMGRSSYMDSASWAQNFCNSSASACGPTRFPPPTVVQYQFGSGSGAQCMLTNTTFPCPGGWADSCPLVLGDCSEKTAFWVENEGGTITNNAQTDAVINVDCNNCIDGTVLKALGQSSSASSIVFNSSSKQLVYSCGKCLNAGQTPPVPPCKSGEFYVSNQIQLQECASSNTVGWERVVVNQ
jgi:hypothetical protein